MEKSTSTPERGAVLSFTPDAECRWRAEFTTSGADGRGDRGWAEAVIGWAVVVTFVDTVTGTYSSEIQPVLLDEGRYAISMQRYLDARDQSNLEWRLVRHQTQDELMALALRDR